MFWHNWCLHQISNHPTIEDTVNADIQNITLEQYMFNKWLDELERSGDGFKTGYNKKHQGPLPVKLTWWKCWFWWAIPGFFLGVDDRMRFKGWNIGHCLNCDANPYDGTVEAWSYDGNWYHGALIRCNKCGQLRWQAGEYGTNY